MNMRYIRGSTQRSDRLRYWFTPTGSLYLDGARLAAINTVGLIGAFALLAVVSIVARVLDRWLPFPLLFANFVAIVLLVAAALLFWHRYAAAYGRRARLRYRATRLDVFGAIGSAPFAFVAVVLLSTGLFSLFLAAITFNLSRAGDALQQLLFSALFFGLALANVIIARTAGE